jgi:hypothetical protein
MPARTTEVRTQEKTPIDSISYEGYEWTRFSRRTERCVQARANPWRKIEQGNTVRVATSKGEKKKR